MKSLVKLDIAIKHVIHIEGTIMQNLHAKR